MRIRELIVEGPGPLDDPLRYHFGAGHLVVRSEEPVLPCLAFLLYGGEPPPGFSGGVQAEIEKGGTRRTLERKLGLMEEGEPFLPVGAFFHLLPRPRPVIITESERAELGARLPQLEAELRALEEMESLDGELQSLQHELSATEARLEERERVSEAWHAAVARVEAYRRVKLPPDLEKRLEAFERARARQEEKERRLRQEIEEVERREAENRVDLRRDRRLWLSVGAGLLLLLLGALSPWKGVAVLSIPSFGISAALLLSAISSLQQREEIGRRRLLLAGRLSESEKEKEASRRDIGVVLEATQSASIEELRAWMREAAAAEEEARARAEDLEALESREEIRGAAAERERLSAAIEAAEKKLTALAAGAFRSPGEVRVEIAEIREKLASGGAEADDSGAFLEAACRCLGCDRAQLLSTVAKRASQLLAALTDGRWQKLGWGASGGIALKGEAGVSRFSELEHEVREAARAALVFAAAEHAAQGEGVVLLLDRPFDDLRPEYQGRLAKALKWLGERGVQIIHRTEVAIFRRAGAILEAS